MDTPSPSRPPSPEALTINSDGLRLAGLLYRPAGTPRGALLVCHGAGSRKENHQLMGEQAEIGRAHV
jgi:poly(3-hydroxybutyrate) depolymerase